VFVQSFVGKFEISELTYLKRDKEGDKFTYKKQLLIGLGPHLIGED